MNMRDEVKKAVDALPEEALEGVLEYIRFITDPVEPSEWERRVLKQGREEFSRGDYVDWEDVKQK